MSKLAIVFILILPCLAFAHCDTLQGPVVTAARESLETGDANLVLIWVKPGDEPEIRQALEQARSVRSLSNEAKQLADRYFFETLVRVHRAGEGAPYTGLKSEENPEPGIASAELALRSGKLDPAKSLIDEAVHHGLKARFEQLVAAKEFDRSDVEAGRKYVAAYVSFLHYIEGLHTAAMQSVEHHEDAAHEEH